MGSLYPGLTLLIRVRDLFDEVADMKRWCSFHSHLRDALKIGESLGL